MNEERRGKRKGREGREKEGRGGPAPLRKFLDPPLEVMAVHVLRTFAEVKDREAFRLEIMVNFMS